MGTSENWPQKSKDEQGKNSYAPGKDSNRHKITPQTEGENRCHGWGALNSRLHLYEARLRKRK